MKKYIDSIDKVVFFTSLICLVWIILYKLYWISMNPIFYNAHIFGDILYTVFTSIIAAGIFYLVTIFLPKLSKIMKSKKYILSYLKGIDLLTIILIRRINKGETTEKYTIDEFLENIFDDNKNQKDDFIAYYSDSQKKTIFKEGVKHQVQVIDFIMSNYYNIIPEDITTISNQLKFIDFYTLNSLEFTENNNKENDELYFNTLLNIIKISRDLRIFFS